MPEELFDPAMVLVADDDTATRNLLSGLLKAQDIVSSARRTVKKHWTSC